MMKILTPSQLQSRKDKAVRFTRDVLGDPDRAEGIEDESLENYAERRGIQIANPSTRRTADLEEENQSLQDQLDAIADIVSGDEEEEEDDMGLTDQEEEDEDDLEGEDAQD
jgi:hypothetical protein